ncbi:DUF3015 family protein [Parvularcula lutaonensis]|uniref:DUF3015 family protein n=1 Tax=Parvularcula lutaonensis TaxID=491923 RepID=A0ABV7M785_9PROT|nr:DUF3015 family protein [Parvularcula lutaonensis]GGY57021.1 hypothetical protein GCM10007148_28170 [Parvularcula lutaonensis]
MKSLLTIASAAAVALTFNAAQAQEMRDAPNPWLDCGIGAMIFPDDNLEVGAGISNIIWDLGTTAVISAASSPDTCAGTSNVAMAVFIERTYPTLEAELAKGYGDNIAALATMVGAEDEAAFTAALRAEMGAVLASEEKSQALYFAALEAAKS